MGNTFGKLFRVTTWGESHGPALGGTIDGCPAGLSLSAEDIQPALDRRRPGQSKLTTPRREGDRVRLLSGLFEGKTTGAPIAFHIDNADVDSSKYDNLRDLYRPSHADWTWEAKFGLRDHRGGGRASARETVSRVVAGAIAEKCLRSLWGVEIVAWVETVHTLSAEVDPETVTREDVDTHPVRCPDPAMAERMAERIAAVRKERDSVGGVIGCAILGVPAGWGEPLFDRFEAALAHAMLSLPASKGFEVGSGFGASRMRGSEHNDPFVLEDGRVRTRSNHSGGVQGGITNGETVVFRTAFKPVATIFQEQETVTRTGDSIRFAAKGRHDPCVLPRAVPIVEAMAALVTFDMALLQRAREGLFPAEDPDTE